MAGHAQDHDFFIPSNNIWPPLTCLGVGLMAMGFLSIIHPAFPLALILTLATMIVGLASASFFGGPFIMISVASAALFYFTGAFLQGNAAMGAWATPLEWAGLAFLIGGSLYWLRGVMGHTENKLRAVLGLALALASFALSYGLYGTVTVVGLSPLTTKIVFFSGLALIIFSSMKWFMRLIQESRARGFEQVPTVLELGNRYGIIFFIVSEIMFFAAFFAAFFFLRSYNPVWPPENIETLSIALPTLNTLLLLTSGTTITWAHHALLNKQYSECRLALFMTYHLGIIFLLCQMYEYSHAAFSINSGVYGSVFYMLTGFHGFHVLLGTIMIIVLHQRMRKGDFNDRHHFYFEATAWYWHFVDVVWIGLFLFMYLL